MKFNTGDLVVEKTDLKSNSNFSVSKVLGYLEGAVLITPWGSGDDGELYHYEYLDKHNPAGSREWQRGLERQQEDALLTPEEALIELKKLNQFQSNLDAEFEATRPAIQEKMKAAALLVQEAGTLAKPFGKETRELRFELRPLVEAFDAAGWRASSVKC